jgi:hypothetical protein
MVVALEAEAFNEAFDYLLTRRGITTARVAEGSAITPERIDQLRRRNWLPSRVEALSIASWLRVNGEDLWDMQEITDRAQSLADAISREAKRNTPSTRFAKIIRALDVDEKTLALTSGVHPSYVHGLRKGRYKAPTHERQALILRSLLELTGVVVTPDQIGWGE